MRNIALKLMYNGTAYHGWQVQKNAVTVCETLQKALKQITGEDVHLTGCGRTDAGVHGSGTSSSVSSPSSSETTREPVPRRFCCRRKSMQTLLVSRYSHVEKLDSNL